MSLVPKRQEYSWRHKFITPQKKKKQRNEVSFRIKDKEYSKPNKDILLHDDKKKIKKKKRLSRMFFSFRNDKNKTRNNTTTKTYEFCNDQFSKLNVNDNNKDRKSLDDELQLGSKEPNGVSSLSTKEKQQPTYTNDVLQSILIAILYIEKEICEKKEEKRESYTLYDIVHFYKDQCHDEKKVYKCTQLLIQPQQSHNKVALLEQQLSNFSIHQITNSIRNILTLYESLVPIELYDDIMMINTRNNGQQDVEHLVRMYATKWKETTSSMFIAFIHHFAKLYTILSFHHPHTNNSQMMTTDCNVDNSSNLTNNTMDWNYMNSLAYTFGDIFIRKNDYQSNQQQKQQNERGSSSIEPKNKEQINTNNNIQRQIKAKKILSMIEFTILNNTKQRVSTQQEHTDETHKFAQNHHDNNYHNTDNDCMNTNKGYYDTTIPAPAPATYLDIDRQPIVETEQDKDENNESWNAFEENEHRYSSTSKGEYMNGSTSRRYLIENAKRRLSAASDVIWQIDQVMLKQTYSH